MAIFEQQKKVVTSPGTQAQAVPEQSRSAYLNRLEQSKAAATEKISDLYTVLGKAYYESHADDHSTEFETQMAAIRELFAEIERFRREADEIAARRRCPACGAQLPEGSQFCNFCGVRLAEVPGSTGQPAPAPVQKACPKCKAAIGPNQLFCVSCGADLRNMATNGGV